MIVATPTFNAVICTFSPLPVTVATAGFEDIQITLLLEALDGETVAMRLSLFPSVIASEALFSITPVTFTVLGCALTVTLQVAVDVLPSLVAVAVIVAVPALDPVTCTLSPLPVTVAILEFDDAHATLAPDGETVAVRLLLPPAVTEMAVGFSEIVGGTI